MTEKEKKGGDMMEEEAKGMMGTAAYKGSET